MGVFLNLLLHVAVGVETLILVEEVVVAVALVVEEAAAAVVDIAVAEGVSYHC